MLIYARVSARYLLYMANGMAIAVCISNYAMRDTL